MFYSRGKNELSLRESSYCDTELNLLAKAVCKIVQGCVRVNVEKKVKEWLVLVLSKKIEDEDEISLEYKFNFSAGTISAELGKIREAAEEKKDKGKKQR